MDTEQLINDSNDIYNRRRCRYTLNRGAQCGSPALRGTNLCYFHSEHRGSPDQVRERKARHNSLIMPPRLQTRAEVQQALATTVIAIAGDDIDPRRAGLLLYALQIASCNLNEHQNNHLRQLPAGLQHLSDDPEAAAKELATRQQLESHPHYGTGPRPKFTPEGEPISTAEGYVSAERMAHEASLPDFTPRPAHWNKIEPGIGSVLLEALGKHHSKGQPLPGKPSDRRPQPIELPTPPPIHDAHPLIHETRPMVIAAMHATAFLTSPQKRVPHVSSLRRGFARCNPIHQPSQHHEVGGSTGLQARGSEPPIRGASAPATPTTRQSSDTKSEPHTNRQSKRNGSQKETSSRTRIANRKRNASGYAKPSGLALSACNKEKGFSPWGMLWSLRLFCHMTSRWRHRQTASRSQEMVAVQ